MAADSTARFLVPVGEPTALAGETAMKLPGHDLFRNYVRRLPFDEALFRLLTRLHLRCIIYMLSQARLTSNGLRLRCRRHWRGILTRRGGCVERATIGRLT
ncbi:hypothetical protein M407DRAFT_155262 [Tulasnella calospora MUT 4182]|uniref:Uncharacterized protein n=1 Tax=Tulasnella calospora MUT 4182 TaxID=1051891 RepID=A0A0C3QPP7_9AGAM|nr:hypothetical protein M407DRAFT_155262 [Tulasnella calospora MUT 4182]